MTSRPLLPLLTLICAATLSLGCPQHPSDGDADADADTEGGVLCNPDWDCCYDWQCSNGVYCDGVEVCADGVCVSDEPIDCDDGFDCTVDSCNERANTCQHEASVELCQDGDVCNGEEQCAPSREGADERGCVAGRDLVCDDLDPCTDDFCADNECQVAIKDADDDGHGDDDCEVCEDPEVPETCERGDDCDDTNPDTFPLAEEICDDGEDNNCDRLRDYADPSCVVPNDTCATAIALVAGEEVHSSTRGTAGDIDSACAPSGDPDVAFTFSIDDVQDVEIDVQGLGGRSLTVATTTSCGDDEADLKCTTGRAFTQIHRALPAGDYAVVVSADGESDFDISFRHGDPVARPAGDQCATAIDASLGGTFSGTTDGFDPDYDASCGAVTDRDVTFAVTVAEPSALDLIVDAGESIAVAIQGTCGVPASELDCLQGDPAQGWVRYVPPGTHYIVIKSGHAVDFELDLDVLPASADSCDEARWISFGSYLGSTIDMEADIDSACGSSEGPDSTYSFALGTESDVFVDFLSHGEATTLSLTSACGDPAAEIRCATGTDFELRGRGLAAGMYHLVATGTRGADYELAISRADPVIRPVGDQCETGTDVSAGGVFSGTTTGYDADYDASCGRANDLDATFAVTVTETSSMNLSVDSGAVVAVAVQSTCGVAATERACLSGNPASGWVRHLPPGTHYIVVRSATEADFTLDVELLPTSSDTCEHALDASTPGTYPGSTVDMEADIDTSCGNSAGPDSAYMVTLDDVADLYVDFSSFGEETTLSLTPVCGDAEEELRCVSGTEFQLRGRGLAAGDYWLVATGDRGADYEMTIDVRAPVPRPAEDLCDGAIEITAGAYSGTTASCENDYEARCGDPLDLDVAYTFTIDEDQSMDLSLTAGAGPASVSVQSTCGVTATERACFSTSGTTERHYRMLEAGTYYLIFKTPTADTFDFHISFGAPEDSVPLNFIGLPYDYFAWDEAAADLIYRAVTYGYGGSEPVVGAVQQCTDMTGATSGSNPVSSAGEYHATLDALVYGGYDVSGIVELADLEAVEAALGTFDVLLFMETEGCSLIATQWDDAVRSHIEGGGRVVATTGQLHAFINALGMFGSGSSGGSGTYTLEDHPFWDGLVHPPSLSATSTWQWSGDYLVPLARVGGSSTNFSVFGYDAP